MPPNGLAEQHELQPKPPAPPAWRPPAGAAVCQQRLPLLVAQQLAALQHILAVPL